MKCRFCENTAEIVLRRHKIALCKKCYPSFFEKQVTYAIEKKKMFSKDDRICVAISGGKDSMSLLHVLKKLGFNVFAIHIDLGIDGYSDRCKEVVENYCHSNDIPLVLYDLKENKGKSIPELAKKKRRPTCSVCGTVKRQITNKLARENNCDVLATGHNLDDELVFVFSNLLNADVHMLARQKPVLDSRGLMVKKVKPLYRVMDAEVKYYADIEEIPYYAGKCPFARDAATTIYKKWWNELEEKRPGIKANFYFGFLRKIQPILESRIKQDESGLRACKLCGEPTNREICSVCMLFLE